MNLTKDFDFQELENAIDSKAPKPVILTVISKAANVPRPIMALAYLKLQKMTDEEVRDIAKLALEVVRRMAAGEDFGELLERMKIPDELFGVIQTYAKRFTQNHQD